MIHPEMLPMGEEGRQCVSCFEVAGKQGGTMAGVQSIRVSSQARVPASRVNQVTLAQGADLLYRHPTSSRGEICKSLERSWPNCELNRQHQNRDVQIARAYTDSTPPCGMKRRKCSLSPLTKSLYELDCGRFPMRRAFPTDP